MTVDPVSLAVTAALTAAQMALQMTRKIEGPRLDDLNVTVADYGTPLNYFYGKRRFNAVPIIWAEPIREVKRKSKTKGGKYNEYSYFGSWAVVVADHEIDQITRVWFDKHLVYDVTGAGPLHPFQIGTTQTANKGKSTRSINVNLSDHFRIYLGTEDQVADPRMVADVESKHGANSCPDYKGVAYIVFEEVPLEKFGNRIPQISVEAIRESVPSYPYETFPVELNNSRLWNTIISEDGNWLMWSWTDGTFETWYLPTRTLIRRGNVGIDLSYSRDGGIDWLPDGSLIGISGGATGGRDFFTMTREGVVSSYATDYFGLGASNLQQTMTVVIDGNGLEHWGTTPPALAGNYFWFDGVKYSPSAMGYSGRAICWFADSFGDIWTILTDEGTTPSLRFLKMVDTSGRGTPTLVTVGAGLPNSGSSYPYASAIHYGDETYDHFVLAWEDDLYAIDCFTGAIIASNTTVLYDVYNGDASFKAHIPGRPTIWLGGPGGGSEIRLSDLTALRTFDPSDWKVEDTDGFIYIPVLNAIAGWPSAGSDVMTLYYLDRPDSDGSTLEFAINDVSTRCGIDLDLIDASEMTQRINYSWTQGTGRDVLEPLLDVHDSIVRPHDFGLEFIKLGRASLGTLTYDEFLAGDSERARYNITIEQDTDIPRRVSVNYADLTADQQPNVASDQRAVDTVDSVRELSINLTTLALQPDDAQQLTERWLRRRWFSRESYGFGVTARKLAIEPGDVYDVNFDGILKRGRVTATTIQKSGSLLLELERDDPLIATLSGSAGQPLDGHTPDALIIPMPTKAFVIDTTLIKDGDNDQTSPLIYYGAGPQADGTWLGATIFESPDGSNSYEDVANIPSYFAASWGYTTAALYDVETCGLWDRGSGVNVFVPYGALTSITEAEANANPLLNRIIFENGEHVQFTTATLESDGSYTLTGLKRGRRGTEWATSTHTPGEAFIVIGSTLIMARGAGDIATNLYFKAVGAADNIDAMPVQTVAFEGKTLKPYSPVHVNATKDSGTGDWTITWIRRTRIGGAWTGGASIPLGENSENYKVVILDGATEVRVIDATSETATYTAAQQTTDFGAEVSVGSLDFVVYQISDIAGRGFGAAASF